jgi:hypothetical protein
MKSKFQELIEEMVMSNDYSDEPDRIFELIGFLNESEGATFTTAKIFLLRYACSLDNDFIIKFLSQVEKELLAVDQEILELFKENDEILLFLKL